MKTSKEERIYGPVGKRVVVEGFGESPSEAIAGLTRIEEQPPPDPARLAPTDVVIAVRSAAVGWVDLLMTSGQYQHMAKPPYTPGLEYSGEVVWKGTDVDHVAVGDRVLADGFSTGPRSHGDHQGEGGFASYAVAPAQAVIKIPGTLSFDQAANLLGNYETAYHCLIARGKLRSGEFVLIHGASGSTGLAAVHLAKLIGATVIATGRNRKKLNEVRAQGADHTICTVDGAGQPIDMRTEVKALTDGKGVHVVYDGVGGPISAQSLRCVRFGARYLIVGWAATPDVARGKGERGAPRANQLPTNLIMMKGLDVLGCPTVISSVLDPDLRPTRLAAVLDWARTGAITPMVGKVFPLDRYRDAMLAKWNSEFTGGCVVHPPG